MPISIKTQKMLWGRAAGRCSYPDCRIDLYEDETETDDSTLVGENCHMVAESDDGPRADPLISLERRNTYSNLILLCRNHHKVIDAQEIKYTLEFLRDTKARHEQWVREQLGFDAAKQKDDEYYADTVDKWEKLLDLENWSAWTSWVLGNGQPSLWTSMDDNIRQLRPWLLARVWPERYPELEDAFKNFLYVANDFHSVFHEYAEERGSSYRTSRFYKKNGWLEKDQYDELVARFEHHVDLVVDLMLEMARAANLICDRIRQYLMFSYRLSEGHLLVEIGPTMDLKNHIYLVRYGPDDLVDKYPYPGLAKFIETRVERDLHFGEGPSP